MGRMLVSCGEEDATELAVIVPQSCCWHCWCLFDYLGDIVPLTRQTQWYSTIQEEGNQSSRSMAHRVIISCCKSSRALGPRAIDSEPQGCDGIPVTAQRAAGSSLAAAGVQQFSTTSYYYSTSESTLDSGLWNHASANGPSPRGRIRSGTNPSFEARERVDEITIRRMEPLEHHSQSLRC